MDPSDAGSPPAAAAQAAVTGVIPPVGEPATPSTTDAAPDPAIVELGRHAVSFARAWLELVAGEAALAKANLFRLLLGALVVPALAFGIIGAIDALLAASLFALAGNWMLAIGAVTALNIALLLGLLWLVRDWWRTLSLPQSRDALTRLWRNHGAIDPNRKGADPGRTD
jgi:uncharacterized membrane protein YqjE